MKAYIKKSEFESIFVGGGHGICLICESIISGVKSDAENYSCPNCGKDSVFGIQQASKLNKLTFEKPTQLHKN